MNEIVQGDCLEVMKSMPDNSVDLVCTDPPYGYSFMGKNWDRAVPSVGTWKECLRVLKPGAFAFIMSAPRRDVLSQMIVRIGEAGFDTGFTSIYWTYASGFPKAMNIGKMVDKRMGTYVPGEITENARFSERNTEEGSYSHSKVTRANNPQSSQAKALDGSYGGFQPKPAVEVIIVAMKPLSEKTYVDQALKNGKGISWLDDCRVPTGDSYDTTRSNSRENYGEYKAEGVMPAPQDARGRFPANLLVSDDVLNDGFERKKAGNVQDSNIGDYNATSYKFGIGKRNPNYYNDSGSYSRFFDIDAWWAKTFPFLIVPKAAKSEKNEGLANRGGRRVDDGRKTPIDNPFLLGETERKNTHPTVKPLKLMSYLITLGSRPGDVVLDPFAGSGTTCLAAQLLKRNWIGIELQEEYCEIARARLKVRQPALV